MSFAPAAERNKQAIGDALSDVLEVVSSVLEIGSGTGQHAVYLTSRYANLNWQPTDRADALSSIAHNVANASANIQSPLELDVATPLQLGKFDLVFSANTAHIMRVSEVEKMFAVAASHLKQGGLFVLYGPFKINDQHTAVSNARFDAQLKAGNPEQGIRDKSLLDGFAQAAGLIFSKDIEMPANNRVLMWSLPE